ncbi:MAG: hypothetical protein EZS28_040602 [Streblomastix strix]|uniref:Uncharacterized protein n=1 Tax=Streblomastix strix TaxID=222440 RepID=A0A5J4U1L0_9EUKA|nr:MAG: hypothetical protein EZS28_040602 [Streblomastix strix]
MFYQSTTILPNFLCGKKGLETQVTTSRNQIVRSLENYFYRKDATYAMRDSQAKFLQHQIELTTAGDIPQIT